MNVPRSGGGESEPISKVRHRVEQHGQLSHHPFTLLRGHFHPARLPVAPTPVSCNLKKPEGPDMPLG